MVRRLALAAAVAVVGMAFLIAPATAGSTVTKMRFELGSPEVSARSGMSGSVSLWAKYGASWIPVRGATLSLTLDGRPFGTIVTDAAGFAVVSIPADLRPGGHVMKVVYDGDGINARTQRSHGFSVSGSGGGGGSTCVSVPAAPVLLSADTTAAGEVTVVWAPPASDGGCPIAGYNVYRGPDRVGSTGGSATSFVETSVPSGLHFYTVTAVNGAGEGLPSNEMFVSI